MIKKILERLDKERIEFENANKTVAYNMVFSTFIIQSIIDSLNYYHEQTDSDYKKNLECEIFGYLDPKELEKILNYPKNLLEHIRDCWMQFRHRDRYDIFGLNECEGWGGTYNVINQVFRFWT